MRLSRFDITVLGVSLALIAAIVVSVLLLRKPPQPQRVAYIYPADSAPQNIWAVVPGQPETATQLTDAEFGIFDFAPSPDGRLLAYAERDFASNRINLKLLDIASGASRTLVDCGAVNADCTTPAWRADGTSLAFMRRDVDVVFGGLGMSRIWIIDGLDTATPDVYPMTSDPQTVGSSPVWSKDGRRLAFYEDGTRGVLVFDFNAPDPSQTVKFIPADNGMTGVLSPSGEQLITTTIAMSGGMAVRAQLVIADLLENSLLEVYPDGLTNDGQAAAWHPDGRRIAMLRQYMDGERFTRGQQVYIYDTIDKTLTPLIFDDTYNNGSLSFSPDGTMLLIQRFQFGGFQPGIWTYDMETGELNELVANAYLPAWVAGTPGD